MPLSDAEIVCSFMEPKPDGRAKKGSSKKRWWIRARGVWRPRVLALDACHEVEARLTDKQQGAYCCDMLLRCELDAMRGIFDYADAKSLWHATAEQKIAALAAVLRPIVEKTNDRA